ncbi:MAG: hypothetical protein ABUJ98_09070 [Hyphomicrobium sp.]|jgi:hypothetical protein
MTRTILAIATAFLAVMTVFASAADAGFKVRLGFGGPLPAFTAHGPSKSYGQKRYSKKRSYRAKRKARTAKKRIVKRKPTAKTVETAPIKTDAENENSTISTASLDKNETIETEAIAKDEPKATRKVGCKKFFPTVGMTLTVPCE